MVCVQCLFSLFFSFFLFFILFISVVFHKYLWQNLMPNVVKYKCSVSSHFSSERWTLCARCTHVQQRFIIDIIIGHVRRDLFAIIYERSVWASVVLICCILMWLWCLCWSAVVASGGLVAHPHTLSLSLSCFFFVLIVCVLLFAARSIALGTHRTISRYHNAMPLNVCNKNTNRAVHFVPYSALQCLLW